MNCLIYYFFIILQFRVWYNSETFFYHSPQKEEISIGSRKSHCNFLFLVLYCSKSSSTSDNREAVMNRKKGGFTLVELIVVIVIILILAAVLVPSLLKYVSKAKKAAAISECKEVVQATQRVAADLAAEEVLTSIALNDKRPAILKEADAGGSFETDIEFEEDTAEVLSFEYLAKNGLHVIFDINHKPQVYIEEGDPTLTKINNYIKDAADYISDLKGQTNPPGSLDRKRLIENAIQKDGLLKVSDSEKQGSNFKDKELYWHPYYLGGFKKTNENPVILFANYSSTDHGQWLANLVYLDGRVYEAPNDKTQISKLGINSDIGGFQDIVTDYASAEKWLKDQGYKPIS